MLTGHSPETKDILNNKTTMVYDDLCFIVIMQIIAEGCGCSCCLVL